MAEAVKWYKLAAMQGHADAQYALGMCLHGGGGPGGGPGVLDEAQAARWLRAAAEQEHTEARQTVDALYTPACPASVII